jgi:hypothetical protein
MRGSRTRTAVWAATVAVWVMSCAVDAATAAAPTTITPLHGETTIEAYGGVAAWSDYDAAARSWHVVVRRAGQISTPPIPTAKKAIEVDVGPGPTGAPMLAYAACASSCHVVVANVDGSDPRTVPGSRGASHPTIWGDRVAWVSGAARIMTSRLNGRERSMLVGLPRRLCLGVSAPHLRPACQYPAYPSVEALQLQGRHLAFIDSFGAPEGTTEVRMEAITGGPARLVARMNVGLSARTWLGPSWFGGKLYFYMQSLGAGIAVWAFDPARNTYVKAPAVEWLSGFSMINSRQAIVATGPGAGAECGEAGVGPCLVRLSRRFAFKPSKPLLATPD